jgi:hypothetical protein
LWSRSELVSARPILAPTFTDDKILQRFQEVGGVPRHIFANDLGFKVALAVQQRALNQLTADQAVKIARNQLDAVGSFSVNQPKSALIGYQMPEIDNGSFEKEEIVIISLCVQDFIYINYIKDLWSTILNPTFANWKIFETYTHHLMALPFVGQTLKCRVCVGFNDDRYDHLFNVTLGRCKETQLVDDITEAAKETRNVLFHSSNLQYPLIDSIYQDEKGVFHAIQASLAVEKHKANVARIKELEKAVGGSEKLNLYYFVPQQNFKRFRTDPVNPGEKGASCKILHVMVPDPNRSKSPVEEVSEISELSDNIP